MKKQNGITLIALVITIIVLLILAGITIAMISGQDSAPAKAAQAKIENDKGAAKDAAALLVTDYIGQYYDGKYVGNEAAAKNAADVGAYINAKLANPVTKGDYTFQVLSGEFRVSDSNGTSIVTGTINSNGTIVWNGEATSSGNNSGNTNTGMASTNIKVGNDTIDLSTLNASTVAQYYGTTVATLDNVDYGLFYVDYAGTYSNGVQGTIYLRAKTSVGSTTLGNPSLSDTALTIMKQINPMWEINRGSVASTSWTAAEKGAQHLCNPDVTAWSNAKSAAENKFGVTNVNYVIGGPSIELYLASYNAKYTNSPYSAHFNLNRNLDPYCEYPGYIYSNDGGTSYLVGYPIPLENAGGGIYIDSVTDWLASPVSSEISWDVGAVYDWSYDYNSNEEVGLLTCEEAFDEYGSVGVAPLVSLKPGVNLMPSN